MPAWLGLCKKVTWLSVNVDDVDSDYVNGDNSINKALNYTIDMACGTSLESSWKVLIDRVP